jgi:hypothetical protein
MPGETQQYEPPTSAEVRRACNLAKIDLVTAFDHACDLHDPIDINALRVVVDRICNSLARALVPADDHAYYPADTPLVYGEENPNCPAGDVCPVCGEPAFEGQPTCGSTRCQMFHAPTWSTN